MTVTLNNIHLYNDIKQTYQGKEFTIYSRKDHSLGYVIIEGSNKEKAYAGVNIGMLEDSHPFVYTGNLSNVNDRGIKVLSVCKNYETSCYRRV